MPTNGLDEKDVRKVLEPDNVNNDQEFFVFGSNPDGTPRQWKYRPLDWKYERPFRQQVMPMFASQYKPVETLIGNMSQKFITEHTPSVIKALSEAEVEMDGYLTKAMHIILLSQDKNITLEWVEDNAKSRDEMMDIVEKQAELHKIMDRLGERWAGRLQRLATMVGIQVDLPTLKRLWKQVSGDFSAKITNLTTTAHNAFGQSTESSLETSTRNFIREIRKPEERRSEAVLEPLIEELNDKNQEPTKKQ